MRANTSPAPFGPTHPSDLTEIGKQLGEVRCYLDLGATAAARAQLDHTQALVLELARVARLDLMFPGA